MGARGHFCQVNYSCHFQNLPLKNKSLNIENDIINTFRANGQMVKDETNMNHVFLAFEENI